MTKTARLLAFFAAFSATIVFAVAAAATASAFNGDGGGGGTGANYTGSCQYYNHWQIVTFPGGAGICWEDGWWYLGGGRYLD